MNLKKKIINLGLIFTTLVIGISIGKLFDIPYAKLKTEIDAMQLISIGVTVWIAFIIATIIDKEKDENKREKELILKRTEDLYLILDDFNQRIITGELKYKKTTSTLKRINTTLKLIFKVINETKISINTELKDIQKITRKLNVLLTETPINEEDINGSDLPIKIKDSIIKLNNGRVIEIESKFDSLKNMILVFQLEINKG